MPDKTTDEKFQITAGVGVYEDHLFCTRRVRSNGLHQVIMMKPNGKTSVFALSQKYFVSELNVVKPSEMLSKFCNHVRREENPEGLKIWMGKDGAYKFVDRSGWIGVDLDGTLAHYDGWKGIEHIGKPLLPMVNRVKHWLRLGIEVKVFTARVSVRDDHSRDVATGRRVIEEYTAKHIGLTLPITNVKDFKMIQLWDDRCVQVEKNTGLQITEVIGSRVNEPVRDSTKA